MEQPFEASIPVRASFEHACEVLVTDAGCVVAERRHRHPDVEVIPAADRRQGLKVEFAPAKLEVERAVIAVRWVVPHDGRPLSSFAGELEVRRDDPGSQVTLRGTYELREEASTSDRTGAEVAEQALRAFLIQAGSRLDSENDRRMRSVAWRPAPYPDALHRVGSENFIG